MDAPRCAQACTYCRLRKVRCDGSRPCGNCRVHRLQCVVLPPQRRKRYKTGPPSLVLGQRLTDIEAMLSSMTASKANEATPALPSDLNSIHPAPSGGDALSPTAMQLVGQKTMALSGSQSSPTGARDANSSATSWPTPQDHPSPSFQRKESVAGFHYPQPCRTQEDVASVRAHVSNTANQSAGSGTGETGHKQGNYYDAESWLAVCSSQGMRWVAEHTGEPEFPEHAKDLSVDWLKRLHRQQALHASRMPEPDEATAWKYTRAFFAEDFGRFLCNIPRAEFETKLGHYFQGKLDSEPDPAWYALRHTVYASGCRILLTRDPAVNFSDAQAQSWKYFENAVSVHLDLLYSQPTVHTVRALIAMTQYLEHSGDPSLSYIMCGNAARLAQAIGLHRRPESRRHLHQSDDDQDTADEETVVQTWLFWGIYCLDKLISQRLGRPSAIDDSTITCSIPTRAPAGSALDLSFCTLMIKLARIRSCISRSIFAAPGELSAGTPSVVPLIARLSEDLRRWRNDHIRLIAEAYTPGAGSQLPARPPPGRLQRLSLELGYHSSVIHLHSALALPWLDDAFTSGGGETLTTSTSHAAMRAISSHAVSTASRNIIETICQLSFDGSTPRWMVFQLPMVGVINLFISILKNPTAFEVEGDLALLDAAAQHFDRLRETSDAQLSFTFAHEMADLARRTISRVEAKPAREGSFVSADCDRSRRHDQHRALDGSEDTTMLHADDDKAPFHDTASAAAPWDSSTTIDSVGGFDMEQWEMFINAPNCSDLSFFHSTHPTENPLITSFF